MIRALFYGLGAGLLFYVIVFLLALLQLRRTHNRNARLGWPWPGAVKPIPWWKL